MVPSIENNRGAGAVKSALDPQTNLSSSIECIIEALEICLTNNTSLLLDKMLQKQIE